MYLTLIPSYPWVFCIDSYAGTRTHGSIPTLRPAFAVQVRVIPQVRVRVVYLRAAGLPMLLPNCSSIITTVGDGCPGLISGIR